MSNIGRAGLESAARFGHHAAALYPWINKQVQTPQGPGILLQVLAGEAHVLLDGTPESRQGHGSRAPRHRPVSVFDFREVRPIS